MGNALGPGVGLVVRDQWGSWTTCHRCGGKPMVNREGLTYPHDEPRGGGVCRGEWMAATLNAAIARDELLTDEERAVRTATWGWLNRCRGYLTTGEQCWHRYCLRLA